jgi:hypothetical protein
MLVLSGDNQTVVDSHSKMSSFFVFCFFLQISVFMDFVAVAVNATHVVLSGTIER